MHELSIVMSIIDIAESHARNANSSAIEEVELDIGELSGVEMASFDFAWQQATKQTLLDGARRQVNRIPGKAVCLDCSASFAIQQLYDPCPVCGNHLLDIVSGKELRVRSLIVV